ncbi:MAG: YkvA family protein [Woeseia sp.]
MRHTVMPLDITFTLSDKDLNHFQEAVDQAKAVTASKVTAEQVVAAASKLIEEAHAAELPEYIASRLIRLQVIIDMLGDKEWNLGDDDRKRVIGALTYFCAPDDIIPDSVPGFGYLDDAIYVELVMRELKAEITSYEEFCTYRSAEETRRREKGLDPKVNREEWLADKRASLQSSKPKSRSATGRWRLRW